MEPLHEVGKEARERLERRLTSQKRARRILILSVLLIGVITVAFKWTDIKATLVPVHVKNNKENAKSHHHKAEGKESAALGGISIVKKWDLPKVLTEISGLAYLDENHFACVQDESGIIYIYNTATSSIEKEIHFGESGDYEGLTIVGKDAWILRADGSLFEVSNFSSGSPAIREYKTELGAGQDVEGLCYDERNGRLLVAIKNEKGTGEFKEVYAFDLKSRKLNTQPIIKINAHGANLSAGNSKKNKQVELMPSEIAIHPITRDIYITDGQKSKLLIIDSSGVIEKMFDLNSVEFSQPEGITFSPSGEIFISNEGVRNPGNILKVAIDAE